MKHIYFTLLLCLGLSTSVFSTTYLQSNTYIGSYTKLQLDSLLDANGVPSVFLGSRFKIDLYRMNYLCKNEFDTLVLASGLFVVPDYDCDLPLFAYSHGTQSVKLGAPSYVGGSEPFIGMVMGANGYLSIMPDYLGLGDGAGLHPYQHAKTEAYANIYMLRAVKEYCASNGIGLNNQLFLTGYSQGGHASMATHRMIEKDFASEFTVTASAPMSGAYDMDNTMVDVMLADSAYAAPAYLPYLVLSWNPIYHMYSSISDVFKVPYDTSLPPLFNGMYSLGYVEARMPNVPKLIFDSTELYNFSTNLSHPFRIALKDNNSYTNWTPVAPLRMFYCTADRQVNYRNTIVARDSLKAQGCTTCEAKLVSTVLDHQDCAQYAIIMAKNFMDSIKIDNCANVGIQSNSSAKVSLTVYPNPASHLVSVDYLQNGTFAVVISDLAGKIIYEQAQYHNQSPIRIDGWSNGMYVVKIVVDGKIVSKKLIVNQ